MNTRRLHERLNRVTEQISGVAADYLPHLPRTLEGAARAVLEDQAETAIKYHGAQAAFEDVQEATDEELLTVLGFTPDQQGLGKFIWVKQHWIALILHNFKQPHNCGAYCPRDAAGGGARPRPYVPRTLIFRGEYDRLWDEANGRKQAARPALASAEARRAFLQREIARHREEYGDASAVALRQRLRAHPVTAQYVAE